MTEADEARKARRVAEGVAFANTYPEHAKLQALGGANDIVGQFLEWLGDQTGYVICEWHDATEASIQHDGDRSGYQPARRSIEDWLAAYYGIDREALSKEKDAMLRALREEQGMDADGNPTGGIVPPFITDRIEGHEGDQP